jgi:hypothetical protein
LLVGKFGVRERDLTANHLRGKTQLQVFSFLRRSLCRRISKIIFFSSSVCLSNTMALADEKARGSVNHIDAEQAHDQTLSSNPEERSPWKSIWANPKIVALCLFANIGALMYGFDNLVLSLALSMPPFQ